uniref:Uncharacterized protein n=1 Tax=Hippocampus comes TaxID=109280 RepID=A0A3Q2Y7Z6_HIPCM
CIGDCAAPSLKQRGVFNLPHKAKLNRSSNCKHQKEKGCLSIVVAQIILRPTPPPLFGFAQLTRPSLKSFCYNTYHKCCRAN